MVLFGQFARLVERIDRERDDRDIPGLQLRKLRLIVG
jgi:hypothetical protein